MRPIKNAFGMHDKKAMLAEATAKCEELNIDLLLTEAGECSVGQQQMTKSISYSHARCEGRYYGRTDS